MSYIVVDDIVVPEHIIVAVLLMLCSKANSPKDEPSLSSPNTWTVFAPVKRERFNVDHSYIIFVLYIFISYLSGTY